MSRRATLSIITAALGLALASRAASAQSFNIDFGPSGAAPPSTYAAAGIPGFWNSVAPVHGGPTLPISNTNGVATGARISNIGGTALLQVNDPATTGDDDTLMDDFFITYNPGLETCIFLTQMQNGHYEVLMYGMMPNRPDVKAYIRADQSPQAPQTVGGAWPGHHQLLVTYSRLICDVTDGRLYVHSGIVPGANAADGAALSGMQVRLIPPCPADFNGDGAVNAADLAQLLGSWGHFGGPFDLDGDGTVGATDLAQLLGAWGACP